MASEARRFLNQINLLPARQSGSMGGAIWRETVAHMRKTGASAFEGNDRARCFYERRGGRTLTYLHTFDWHGRPFHKVVYLFGDR